MTMFADDVCMELGSNTAQDVMFAHLHEWKSTNAVIMEPLRIEATQFVFLQPSHGQVRIGSVEDLPAAMKAKWAGKLPGL